jgi:hypothetical protein
MRRKRSRVILFLVLISVMIAGWVAGRDWLRQHPQHNPWAPFRLDEPDGLATRYKLDRLRADSADCRAVMQRSGIRLVKLEATGAGACRREDRVIIPATPVTLSPDSPQATCAVGAGLLRWLRQVVQPEAKRQFGSRVVTIEHLGTFACRKMRNDRFDRMSEHATGNAIDVSAFVLADGRRITVLQGWKQGGSHAAFLRKVRDGACGPFGTVLSPDYNAAHADHFHLDQARWNICR